MGQIRWKFWKMGRIHLMLCLKPKSAMLCKYYSVVDWPEYWCNDRHTDGLVKFWAVFILRKSQYFIIVKEVWSYKQHPCFFGPIFIPSPSLYRNLRRRSSQHKNRKFYVFPMVILVGIIKGIVLGIIRVIKLWDILLFCLILCIMYYYIF